MTSQIDPSIPHEGHAYTANVRANFLTAQQEITALQDAVTSLQTIIGSLQADNLKLKARAQAAAAVTSQNPPDTQSHSFICAGLMTTSFSPTGSTRAVFTAEGSLGNNSNGAESDAQLVWGTGDPPAQGTLVSDTNGELVGTPVVTITTKAGEARPFSATALLTDMVAGDPYWVDIAYCCQSGVAQLSEVTLTAFELIDPLPATP